MKTTDVIILQDIFGKLKKEIWSILSTQVQSLDLNSYNCRMCKTSNFQITIEEIRCKDCKNRLAKIELSTIDFRNTSEGYGIFTPVLRNIDLEGKFSTLYDRGNGIYETKERSPLEFIERETTFERKLGKLYKEGKIDYFK